MANTVTCVVETSPSSHPVVLVDTTWDEQRLTDSNVCAIEPGEDVLFYEKGHIPNAVKIDWHSNVLGSSDGSHPRRMWTLTTWGGGLEL